jgi:hypothetical protein
MANNTAVGRYPMTPVFTRKDLKAASTKRPTDWRLLRTLPARFSVALEDVLKGESTESSRIDLATLYSFMMSAKELGHIDDDGLIESSVGGLAKAYTRTDDGKPFRLDAVSAEALKEMIPTYELLAKSLSARDYMKVCNHVPLFVKGT